MIIVIIAGGSGTRLWPLSQPHYPKHLLKLTGETSLLENTYRRAKEMTDDIYVITEASHSAEVASQLAELNEENIIVEPGRRGTASCIALALAHLSHSHPENEPVVFLHADHHITDTKEFAKTVQAAAHVASEESKISLIGLTPTYPATGFGYIQAGGEVTEVNGLQVYEADSFKEKPDFTTAEKYLKQGNYFWNLGLFAAPLKVFVDEMRENAPELYEAYESLRQAAPKKIEEEYLSLESQPIDTALIEKTKDLLVIPGRFDWADIGSFFDLHKVLKEEQGNSIKGEVVQLDCEDSMIHASTKPVIAIGLSGIVVVDTPEGLLVCSKEKSQQVGDLAKKLQQG